MSSLLHNCVFSMENTYTKYNYLYTLLLNYYIHITTLLSKTLSQAGAYKSSYCACYIGD